MPAGGMKDARIILVVFAATLLITVVTALVAPPDGPGANAPTSFSGAPAGGKAAFLTLQVLGYPVQRSFEPVAQLRAEPRKTVLLLTGGVHPSDQDKRAMQAFVAAGGIALLAGTSGAAFLGLDGLQDEPAAFRLMATTHRVLTPSPIVDGVTEITIAALEQELTFGPEYVPLFAQTAEQPLVSTAVVGAGRVVWLSAPVPLMNEHVASADNLQLLLNVIGRPGDRQVLWDEHYHGNTRSLWSYVVNTPLPWIAGQVAFMFGCAVFAWGRRRAPVRARPEIPRTSSLEFIDMLGALYRRAQAASAAVSVARTRFLRAVASVCGVTGDRGDEAVARAASARLGIDPQPVLRALATSGRSETPDGLDQKTAVSLTAELQALTMRLTALRSTRQPAPRAGQES